MAKRVNKFKNYCYSEQYEFDFVKNCVNKFGETKLPKDVDNVLTMCYHSLHNDEQCDSSTPLRGHSRYNK